MAKFLALTSFGLRDVLEDEIREMGLKIVDKEATGVFFESNWEGAYRANLCLRTATKILLPVLDFPAYKPEDLYHNIQKHDFTKYIRPDQTLSIDAHVRESALQDQRFVAMKIKDAIVDQFRDKCDGQRPDVERENPALDVVVRVFRNEVNVSINTTGPTLSMRGYRKSSVMAPLREHLAAGLIRMTGWNGHCPLVDPMCGSGTFLIEAGLMALNIAPGTLRKRFAFQGFKGFQEDAWKTVLEEAMDKEFTNIPSKIYGFDIDGMALRAARANAEGAGVSDFITLKKAPIVTLEPPPGNVPGIVIVNPPYGERLGITEELKDVYRDLAHALKVGFKGWKLFLLSGNQDLTAALKLKAEKRHRVYNGNLDCRFLEYHIR
ncbi:MAG: RNA methyltransferase [Bdellovibrionaceae bacterium]|nr:RNA methyltransferase [Bdellovibrionales bacterium]MCB9085984.1 RNA methyltransferase [Pseudobdellovibrionaceae bacterium]